MQAVERGVLSARTEVQQLSQNLIHIKIKFNSYGNETQISKAGLAPPVGIESHKRQKGNSMHAHVKH